MTTEGFGQQRRRLESADSPAAHSPAAWHDDALSPVEALEESTNASGSQRVGESGPVANPLTSFPEGPESQRQRED